MAASAGSSSTVGCFPSLPHSYTGINFYHKDSDVSNDKDNFMDHNENYDAIDDDDNDD